MMKIKLAVIGSRTVVDREKIYSVLDKNLPNIDYIVSGGADGADSLANEYCKDRGISIKIHYPKWYENGVYNKGAGFIRNKNIVAEADHVICFWDGVSKGSMNSVEWAEKLGKPFSIVECENPLKNYYIFAASTAALSPYNKEIVIEDKSKGVSYESIYQGYCYYFSKFIKNTQLEAEALNNFKYIKTFDGIISENMLGAEKWKEWLPMEQKVLKYLYKLKVRAHEEAQYDVEQSLGKTVLYANTDIRFGCGLKRNEITVDNYCCGDNIIGKVIESLRVELHGK